ncbi:hypothetical protein OUZ56_005707 [Daphnia magna]|uniref:Uncharacterized protein n=1 Tax=Daphnia magna TaxID=35525 RepID=A0ABQ9YTJ3_9CRUS|nr:hypothetical protein OUZ56_005707 [Daphnia magna]
MSSFFDVLKDQQLDVLKWASIGYPSLEIQRKTTKKKSLFLGSNPKYLQYPTHLTDLSIQFWTSMGHQNCNGLCKANFGHPWNIKIVTGYARPIFIPTEQHLDVRLG